MLDSIQTLNKLLKRSAVQRDHILRDALGAGLAFQHRSGAEQWFQDGASEISEELGHLISIGEYYLATKFLADKVRPRLDNEEQAFVASLQIIQETADGSFLDRLAQDLRTWQTGRVKHQETKALDAQLQEHIQLEKENLPSSPSPADAAIHARKLASTIHSVVVSHDKRSAADIVAAERAAAALSRAALKELKVVLQPLYGNQEIRSWRTQDRRDLVDHINDIARRCGMVVAGSTTGPWGALDLEKGEYFRIKYTHPDTGATTSKHLGTPLPRLHFRRKQQIPPTA